jgi:hypothetical protein
MNNQLYFEIDHSASKMLDLLVNVEVSALELSDDDNGNDEGGGGGDDDDDDDDDDDYGYDTCCTVGAWVKSQEECEEC